MLPLGACLFFLSDCILVVREYRREKSAVMNGAIWSTYLTAPIPAAVGGCGWRKAYSSATVKSPSASLPEEPSGWAGR